LKLKKKTGHDDGNCVCVCGCVLGPQIQFAIGVSVRWFTEHLI